MVKPPSFRPTSFTQSNGTVVVFGPNTSRAWEYHPNNLVSEYSSKYKFSLNQQQYLTDHLDRQNHLYRNHLGAYSHPNQVYQIDVSEDSQVRVDFLKGYITHLHPIWYDRKGNIIPLVPKSLPVFQYCGTTFKTFVIFYKPELYKFRFFIEVSVCPDSFRLKGNYCKTCNRSKSRFVLEKEYNLHNKERTLEEDFDLKVQKSPSFPDIDLFLLNSGVNNHKDIKQALIIKSGSIRQYLSDWTWTPSAPGHSKTPREKLLEVNFHENARGVLGLPKFKFPELLLHRLDNIDLVDRQEKHTGSSSEGWKNVPTRTEARRPRENEDYDWRRTKRGRFN